MSRECPSGGGGGRGGFGGNSGGGGQECYKVSSFPQIKGDTKLTPYSAVRSATLPAHALRVVDTVAATAASRAVTVVDVVATAVVPVARLATPAAATVT